jgi:hypothetical protein
MLDHEQWPGRSLSIGDKVSLAADPPIQAVVKDLEAWRDALKFGSSSTVSHYGIPIGQRHF